MNIERTAGALVPLTSWLLAVLILIGMLGFGLNQRVSGLEVPITRSLSLGDTTPGVSTDYTISWQYSSPTTVGSIRLQFCDNGFIEEQACVNPGASFAAASLAAQSGETGFSIIGQSADELLLGRTPAMTVGASVSYIFDNVANPAGLSERFFVRILIYPSADGTGAFTVAGSVLSATAEPITITTEVPPELVFCVGLTVAADCSAFTGNFIDYGDLSSTATRYAISQFGVVTNASGGYVVTANGATMTSGSNVINAANPPALNLVGTSQFGMNLRANFNPPTGQDPTGLGTSTIGTGYDTQNFFKFVSGDIVASSPAPTHYNGFTVTYIVNVPASQPGGIYNTTINYVCTASF